RGRKDQSLAQKDQSLAQKLSYARSAEAKAIALADEVALLARWLRDDILSVAGPEYAIRRDLLDFVVAELRARESACPQRIGPVRTLLEKQRDKLFWPSLCNWTVNWRPWPKSGRSVRRPPGRSCRCNPCRRGTRSGGVVRRPCERRYEGVITACAPTCRNSPIGLCGPAVWSRTSTAGCAATSSCGGSWGRTT